MFFCWSLCANESQVIWKFTWHSNTTSPTHLSLEFLVGHMLVIVNHVECAQLWHCCLKLQSFPNNHKTMVSWFTSYIYIHVYIYIIFFTNWKIQLQRGFVGWFEWICYPSFEWGWLSIIWRYLSGGLIKKTNPNLISNPQPLKTTIDIPIRFSSPTW